MHAGITHSSRNFPLTQKQAAHHLQPMKNQHTHTHTPPPNFLLTLNKSRLSLCLLGVANGSSQTVCPECNTLPFPNKLFAGNGKVLVSESHSVVSRLFATPWTVACLSMEFSRQEY